jgi:hypothetical protein
MPWVVACPWPTSIVGFVSSQGNHQNHKMVEPYRLSFTTGGLFINESEDAARRYLQSGNWKAVRAEVRAENALQVRTAAAALRISQEIVARMQTLSTEEITFLFECSANDRAHLLWSAVCRRYTLVQEFARDVLREHFVLMRRQILLSDFDAFYNQKALWHSELDELAKSTQSKLRQNLFRMMREAGYINDQHTIAPALLTPSLAKLLAKQGFDVFLIYPVTDLDIKRWLQ